jgi:hypothetical protein
MALLPKINLYQNSEDNSVVEILDTTGLYSANNSGGYNSPNLPISDSFGVLRVGNYLSLQSLNSISSGALTQYKEYIKTAGTIKTYDNKLIGVGSIFTPFIAGITVQSGDTFEETGYYYTPIGTWRPSVTTPIYLTSENLGLGINNTIIDTILPIEYKVFGASVGDPLTVVGMEYLVQSDGATYENDTYRAGETFTAYSVASASGDFSPYEGGYYNVFQTSFNITQQLKDLIVSNINNPKPQNEQYQTIIARLYSRIQAMTWNNGLGNVSQTNTYDNIQDIANTCTALANNNY